MTHLAYLLSGDVWGLSLGTRLPVAICQLSTDASFISTSLAWFEGRSTGNHRCLSQVQDIPPKAFPENIRKPSKTASQTIQTPPATEKRLFQFHSWGRNCTTLGGWRRVQERYHEILNGLVCKSTGKHVFKAFQQQNLEEFIIELRGI